MLSGKTERSRGEDGGDEVPVVQVKRKRRRRRRVFITCS